MALVSVENNISTIGFRKMASLVRSIQPEVEVAYVVPVRAVSPLKRLIGVPPVPHASVDIDAIAFYLAKFDMIGFSCMSSHADYTKKLISAIRTRNRNTFIVWGGIHCIVNPDDAAGHADAVCVGEGETAFKEFFRLFLEGKDYTGVGNFCFNRNGTIIRNPLLPLQTCEELEALPFPLYADRELIYRPDAGFVPIGQTDYVRLEGLQYNALWSIGCPNRCVYCGNSRFLKNHKDYAKLRHPSVDYIVREVKSARERHPHISTVTFHDDSFMAMPLNVLEEFATKWRREIALPFVVHGLIPRYVHREKMKTLISAGMVRVRMGIQSGSPQTLKFYRRPDNVEVITKALGVIRDYSTHMMTPSYDFIVDNPVETSADQAATIRLLYELPRPFMLNIYPLMIIPGTQLEEIAQKERLDLPIISPRRLSPSLFNLLVVGLALVKPPKRLFDYLLKKLEKSENAPDTYPVLVRVLESLVVIKRALLHVRFGNLSVIPSRCALTLWRSGAVSFLNRRMLQKCASIPKEPVAAGDLDEVARQSSGLLSGTRSRTN
jgi:radical SAM superfamily enzyme YgiQ (UPF0313 family)